jgi:23S rRNA (uridine2552-2'-O)-methyltransferase
MNSPPRRPGGAGSGGGQSGRGSGGRGLTQRLRSTGRRRPSSIRWLERQINDPYVAEAQRQGYRSRAAFKLQQLDDRFHLLGPGKRVIDLGAAPGGWTQVAVERCLPEGGRQGLVVGIDLAAMQPIPGAVLLEGDFLSDDAPERLKEALGGPADLVLSDMAAPATGHARTDHLKIMALAEAAHQFAVEVLKPGGSFVAKVLQGGATQELLTALKRDFAEVRHVKPAASRADSAEIYVVALRLRASAARQG